MEADNSAPVDLPRRSVVVRLGACSGTARRWNRACRPRENPKGDPAVEVTAKVAATLLGVHVATVYRYLERGALPYRRFGADPPTTRGTGKRGGAIRIPLAAIEEMRRVRGGVTR
ncbi:helix-turn-helix domain-containing protein [Kitasatospora sp. NPDC048545]|uniref:helix-turn-helix domain-containing protein n=1 Tax=Kitasatospora sp. NPDC048545 TaxID=3157208 RepID=UPI00340C78FF